ncbi:MAG: hypothetical protein ACRDTE_05550 [Pseudonocardiaceae bacterium]
MAPDVYGAAPGGRGRRAGSGTTRTQTAIQKPRGSSGPAGTWTAGAATRVERPATPGTAFRAGLRTPAQLLALQRSVGNRVTSATLKANPANPANPVTASRSIAVDVTVQRTVTEADRAWARTTNTSVEQVQDAVTAAQREVNTDATAASAALKVVQTEYTHFEERYWHAVSRFTRGVEAAQAREQQLRDSIQTTVELALFGVTGPWTAASVAASTTVTTMEETYKYFEAVQNAASVVDTAFPGAGQPSAAPRPGPSPDIDWSAALSTAISILDETVKQHGQLTDMSAACIRHIRFLGDVRNGSFAGENPAQTPEGLAATRLAENIARVTTALGTLGGGSISEPAVTFKDAAVPLLQAKSDRDLEQELAIRWIGGLSWDQLDEIDTADDYFISIGLIDGRGNRLALDTGWWDDPEELIYYLARTERRAMQLVGDTVDWMGAFLRTPIELPFEVRGPFGSRVCPVPPPFLGQIRDSRGTLWRAEAPGHTSREDGGYVRVTSYTIDRENRTGWQSWGRSEVEQMEAEVTFRVTPVGETGGGAGPLLPSIHAPDD